ncbi:F-box domain protein [Rutstroemia sp. NJR-2017a BVV2]|nr:F-box domain protein [Rutstroemia sp. NJR-2017a BVV2]
MVLNGMRLANGSPDVDLRKSALQELLDSRTLTFDELRLLKAHFDKPMLCCDFITKLPVEILELILQHVSLDDYIAMFCVSRVWRGKLFSENVCASMLRLHFPATWEREYVPLDDLSKKAYFEKIGTLLPSLCLKRQRRLSGKYHSMAFYSFENDSGERPRWVEFGLWSDEQEPFQYKNGRVAIMDHDYCIVVNNLRSHVSMRYTEEHRRAFGAWVLTDSYLVVYVDRPRPRFLAWPLDQEADPISIYLESTIQLLVASGNRVVFSSYTNDLGLFIWYIGQTVQNMHSPTWMTSSFRLTGLIFHPTDQQRLYVFYQPFYILEHERKVQFETSLHIQEYNHVIPQKMWFQPFASSCGAEYSGDEDQVQFIIEPMDDNGLVSIRSPGKHIPCDENGACMKLPPCDHDNREMSRRWIFTSFNILTGEFKTHANHVRDIPWQHVHDSSELFHLVWRDQTIITQPNLPNMSRLIAVNSCGTQHRHISRNLEKASPSYIGFNYQKTGTAFVFDDLHSITHPTGERAEGIRDSVERYWGDDDFLVWSDENGYIVWSFDETTTLPKRWSHNIGP